MNKILKYSIIVIVLLLAYAVYTNYPKLNIITGFAAKNVCSCTFEAEREIESIVSGDNDFSPISFAANKIDFENRIASSTVLGLKERRAIYMDGLGCILLPEETDKENIDIPKPKRNLALSDEPYPYGKAKQIDTLLPEVNYENLKVAVNNAFDPEGEKNKRTRAVVIIYKGLVIAEKYAPDFNRETKLLGWSMTKSITNAVLGVLEKKEKISLDQDNLFKEWENDERSKITLGQMLQMSSGLEWDEDYSSISDVTKMLFLAESMPVIQLEKPLAGEPGSVWNYSSGTTNLLSGFIRNQFSSHKEYIDFWYTEFIDKIGMNSMTVETDPEGNYVGSSYAWATARDWAKFGLLYLNKGNWNGEQILNERWITYSATPAKYSNGEYGAHFWLNSGSKYPNVPKDLFSSNGFQGQYVFIIPSEDLVVVRFGLTEEPVFEVDGFLKGILDAIEE